MAQSRDYSHLCTVNQLQKHSPKNNCGIWDDHTLAPFKDVQNSHKMRIVHIFMPNSLDFIVSVELHLSVVTPLVLSINFIEERKDSCHLKTKTEEQIKM
jgi:hypothetical protein